MDTKKNSKKIMILGIILLIMAGLIVVALKGFNVSLMFGKHEVIELKIGKEVDLNKINEIAKEIFEKKEFVVKELEVFGDSVQINVKTITDEEKENLINQMNEKFEISKTVEDLNVYSVSNKRIRDVIKPYITPMLVSMIVVLIYVLVRFRNIGAVKIILNFIQNVFLTEAILLSVIAVTRLPATDLLIFILMLLPVAELIYTLVKSEQKLELENND